MSTLTEIAEGILANAKRLDAFTSSQGLPSPSFECDTLQNLPPDLEQTRNDLVNSTQKLKRLALGPVGVVYEILFSFTDVLSLRAIYCYQVPKVVPVDDEISYAEIAQACNVDENRIRRFLQHAMTNNIFQESRPGYVRHTAASQKLREEPGLFDAVGFLSDDFQAASTKVIEAMKKYPGSEEPNHTGFNVEYNTSDLVYTELAKFPERARRFGGGMRYLTRVEGYDIKYLVDGYHWSELDKAEATVVDIGGGQGAVSQALASATTKLKFIVQDFPDTIKEGEALLPEHLRSRVTFMSHDFFTPQPVKGADVYFFRWILHNWSDKYCVKILQNLIPAMKDGSRVLLYEYVMPETTDLPWSEKRGRDVDLIMMSCWNAMERTAEEFRNLFTLADPRYHFLGVNRPEPVSQLYTIEAVFREGTPS